MENEDTDEMMSKCKETSVVQEHSLTPETGASDQLIWPEMQTTSLTTMTSDLLHDLAQGKE